MTIGVLWEFFECAMDMFFQMDMQKDTIITSINSVLLNPEALNEAIRIKDIQNTLVNGQDLGNSGVSGYWSFGYDERSVCKFYRCGCLFCHWIFLCKDPWGRSVCKKFIPHPMDIEAMKRRHEEEMNK